MADIKDYTGKITSEHSDKPKYMAMVEAVAQPFVDALSMADGLPEDFDLDDAIGAQLDVVGIWVGVSRNIATPLTGVYFALDTPGLGFDQGAWKGPFDPDSGISKLDDETYRVLLRARIGANRWDGTLEQSKEILDQVFSGDTKVFIQDNQDMSMTIGVAGDPPSAIELALLTGGYIPIKPQSVRVNYTIASADAPVFGFDVSSPYVAGFDVGAWGGKSGDVALPQALDFDFTQASLDAQINFRRASTGTYFDSTGVLRTASIDVPRFDYDPVSLAPKGMLIEGAATNSYLYSQDITNSAWGKSAGSASTVGTFIGIPFGRFTPDTSNGTHAITRTLTMAAGSTVVLSWVAKADGYQRLSLRVAPGGVLAGRVLFDVLTGTITQNNAGIPASITPLADGFFRIAVTFTLGPGATSAGANLEVANTANGITFAGDGVSGILISAAQAESDILSSYIPTTSITATRVEDVAFIPIDTWYKNGEGTLLASSSATTPGQLNRVATLYSSPADIVAIDSNGQCEISGALIGAPRSGTAAVAYKVGSCASAVGGVITGSATPAALPAFPKALYIGSLDGSSQFLNGCIKRLTYQPARIANSELITSTT